MKHYMEIMSKAGAQESGAGRPEAERSPVARMLVRGVSGLIVLIVALVVFTLWEMRADAWQRAEQNSRTVLRTVGDSIEAHAQIIGFAMDMAAAALKEAQGEEATTGAVHRLIAAAAEQAGQVSVILVLDKDGNVIVDSDLDPPREVNLATRDYFKVHQDNPRSADYLTPPLFAVLDHGQPSIVLSRRISDSDGQFVGVLVVGIRLAVEAELLNSLNLGSQGQVMLLSREGIVYLHSHGAGMTTVGADISNTPLFSRLTAVREGSFVMDEGGTEKLVTFEWLTNTRFILSMSFCFREIFAEWWRRALIISSVAFVACAALCIYALLLLRELRRRVAAEARLGELSMTDSLTGLSNRRHFDYMLEREWRRTSRTKSCLSLLFIDADHFKSLNDDFGHMKGDEVLKAIAETITSTIRRPGDFAARFGGEEFAVILPDTNEQAAWTIAEGIRSGVEALDFGGKAHVTVSIGVKALAPAPTLSVTDLIEAADRALYRAKDAGRNRVVLAD